MQYVFLAKVSFNLFLFQRVKEELETRAVQNVGTCAKNVLLDFQKSQTHEDFKERLAGAAKLTSTDNPTELLTDQIDRMPVEF